MLAAAKAAATAGNANLTVFDGNLNPATQTQQLQDAIASGKYDGIILQPVYGPALVPGAQSAIENGIAIGNIDQILGPDNTTAESQVEGQLVNVVFVPSELGRKIGELVVEACADANPCNVGYIWSVKAAALDASLKTAFDEATSVNPNIKIVAEGESFYTTPLGLKAAQDMLAAHPDITVITGADQAITGAVQAVADAGLKDKVKLVGYGGGAIAFQGIASGERYGTVMQAPATEGALGVQMFIDAIRSGTPAPGIDVLANLPDGGVVTKDNVETFLPLAEWPG
jgi:ribose transport system substrate-binding protein